MPVKTITVLPTEEICMVRSISLKMQLDSKKEPLYGSLIYCRKFDRDRDYVMHPQEMSEVDRCLNGYLENEYPYDILDEKILEAIKETYPSAEVRSSLLLFNVDKDKYKDFIQGKKRALAKLLVTNYFRSEEQLENGMPISTNFVSLEIYCYDQKACDYFTNTIYNASVQETGHFAEDFKILCDKTLTTLSEIVNNN